MKCQTSKTMRNSDHEQCRKRCLRNALSAEWASKTCGGPLWNVKHQKTSVPSLWRTACATAEQQQDSCLNHAKQRPRTMPKCCLRNALGEQCRWMSFQNLCVQSLWRTACETAEQQQDSCPNHANQRPRTMPKYCLRNALGAEWASKTFGGPRTPAAFVPKPCNPQVAGSVRTHLAS